MFWTSLVTLCGLSGLWMPIESRPSAAGWAESTFIRSAEILPPSIGVRITCGLMSTINSVRFFTFSVPRKSQPRRGMEPRTGVRQ